jgi:hypothetical protein
MRSCSHARRRPILVRQVAAGVGQPIKPFEEAGIALQIDTVLGSPSFTNALSVFYRKSDNGLNSVN